MNIQDPWHYVMIFKITHDFSFWIFKIPMTSLKEYSYYPWRHLLNIQNTHDVIFWKSKVPKKSLHEYSKIDVTSWIFKIRITSLHDYLEIHFKYTNSCHRYLWIFKNTEDVIWIVDLQNCLQTIWHVTCLQYSFSRHKTYVRLPNNYYFTVMNISPIETPKFNNLDIRITYEGYSLKTYLIRNE